MSSSNRFSSPRLLVALKSLLAVALLAALWWSIDPAALASLFLSLSWEMIGYLLLLSVVLLLISAQKWALFLRAFGGTVQVWHLFRLYLIGYFVNLLLPSFLGGDAVRSWHIGKRVGQHEALAATILERFTGLVAMVSLGLGAVWFVAVAGWQLQGAVILLAVGLVTVVFLALSPAVLLLIGKMPAMGMMVPHLQKIQRSFIVVKQHPRVFLNAMALSLAYHCVTVLNTMAAGYAVGWEAPPVIDLFVVLPLILVVSALPITPAGIGVQEGAFYFFLTAVGATPEQAVGVAILLRAKVYVLALVGGVCWLIERRASRPISQSAPKESV